LAKLEKAGVIAMVGRQNYFPELSPALEESQRLQTEGALNQPNKGLATHLLLQASQRYFMQEMDWEERKNQPPQT
jgi:cytochrome c-type biogenesis protein CcmE